MFIITWLFDKLGYMPKIDVEVGKVDLDLKGAWPFPTVSEDFDPRPKKKPVARKRTTKKPAVVAKTTRAKKVK